MNKIFKEYVFFCLAVCSLFFSCSKNNKDISLYPECFTLENGLCVFVKEDHKVPLAYIEIAVRAGAVTQRRDNAGIFHLYEHMMFKGNSLYPDSASVQKAVSGMGIDDWNGSTGEHCVNYYFTIPSGLLKEGMEFWSTAIREPLLDPKEFEEEKKVVISEITADKNDPSNIRWEFFCKTFFPEAPWQLDPGGTEETVRNATLSELLDMKEKYYVPDNAALFVGGDVDIQTVKTLAQEIFGDWKRGSFDFSSERAFQKNAPLEETQFFVMPDDQVSPELARVIVYYRGADIDFDPASSYPLDVFTSSINSPKSRFSKILSGDEELDIISNDYVGGGYYTARRAGRINFSCVMQNAQNSIPARTKKFYSLIAEELVPEYVTTKKIVSKKQFRKLVQSNTDSDIISAELAERVLGSARWGWSVCDFDYYLNYNDNFKKVTNEDIALALEKYVYQKNAMVLVVLNPENYNAQKSDFEEQGFCEVKN